MRLRDVVRRGTAEREAGQERCDMCSEPVPEQHRHLVDLDSGELLCACRACSLLFDRRAAGGGHFRLIGDRRLRIEGFVLEDHVWASLQVPVEMAFFIQHSREERVAARYPGPMGATESALSLDAWPALVEANPVLRALEPDVEALLVNRARGARQYFLVPIEDCYRLVALMRTRWRGLTGGQDVWAELERYYADLERRAKPVTTEGGAST